MYKSRYIRAIPGRRRLMRDSRRVARICRRAREVGRITLAEALELMVARKQPERYGRFAARWLCLYLEEHEGVTLEDVALLVTNLRLLVNSREHDSGSRS
jgi:hypothetical protein